MLDSVRFIFTPHNIINDRWVFLALDVCNEMLLFLDPSSTIFIAPVVQTGEEIVNRIATEKFGFSLEKIRSPRLLQVGMSLVCMRSACKAR